MIDEATEPKGSSLYPGHLSLGKTNCLFSFSFFKIFILYWNIVNKAVFISDMQQSDSVLHREVSQFRSVQSLSRVRLFGTPRTAVHQASLSNTNSRSLLKLMSIESVMPSSHLILCPPLLLLAPNPFQLQGLFK